MVLMVINMKIERVLITQQHPELRMKIMVLHVMKEAGIDDGDFELDGDDG